VDLYLLDKTLILVKSFRARIDTIIYKTSYDKYTKYKDQSKV
jgi:hypothetical protein